MLSILQKLATAFLPEDYKLQAWDVKRGKRVVKLFECKQMSFPKYWEMGKQRKLEVLVGQMISSIAIIVCVCF